MLPFQQCSKRVFADWWKTGLGLVVTRDGGVPLVSHAYPGNRLDVTQFATMIDLLVSRYTAVATWIGATTATVTPAPQMTVVFDAGQSFLANFARLAPPDWAMSARWRPRTARTCSPARPPTAAWRTLPRCDHPRPAATVDASSLGGTSAPRFAPGHR
jgi:hypothetical protein